jgi:hypothetical protein
MRRSNDSTRYASKRRIVRRVAPLDAGESEDLAGDALQVIRIASHDPD